MITCGRNKTSTQKKNNYCVVDTENVSYIVLKIIDNTKWKIKRIYNSSVYFDRAVIVLKNDVTNMWCRVELKNVKSGVQYSTFYYFLDKFNFITMDFSDVFTDRDKALEEIILMSDIEN